MTSAVSFDKICSMNAKTLRQSADYVQASRQTLNERFTPEVLCDIADAANDGHFEAAARIAVAAAFGDYDNWDGEPTVRASYVDTTLDNEVL